ncbi:phytase [Aliiglaciecola sp. 3_MG-2023]|uniref:phytase n=1 Tax=Aliiglaciecola sp. 3_MG-2023 TaxID=3062644 RepID=UPI0026E1C845|nr:phytase [Aliiglaciecola sp. 3_MG-2023]MDO6694804.1 phytase [Aliiglaciecola sp. 3_MG-2023]
MKSLYLWIAASVVLCACQTETAVTSRQAADSHHPTEIKQTRPLLADEKQVVAGKSALPILHNKQQYWLLTSEVNGISLVDEHGQILSTFAGNMEMLDWRDNIQIGNDTFGLITTNDNNNQEILVLGLDWQSKQLSLLTTLAHPEGQVEALCWYQMPQGHLSVFIADAQGTVEQRIVVDGTSETLVDMPVHEFIGTLQTKSCGVDDQAGILYLVEENIGLWQYPADPEAELVRDLVAAVKPFGQLQGEITHVDVLENGDVLLSTPDQQGVWLIHGQNRENTRFIPLTGIQKPETTNGVLHSSKLLLGIFDDEHTAYSQLELKFPSSKQTASQPSFATVKAYAQTQPMEVFGDAADDPAIWVNTSEPAQSRVLGTNKKQGMMLYDLQGKLLQQLNVGRVNNVDIRYGFTLGERTFDLAAASNRSTNSISLFSLQPDSGDLAYLSDIQTDLRDVYGLCMYQQDDQFHVFVNDTDGRFQQYLLIPENDKINAKLIREFRVPSQPEGCVADDKHHQLYYGEESTGVWQVSARPTKAAARLIATTSDTFVADVEGMGIYNLDDKRYLVASSQGNNSFGVFDLDENARYLGSFRINMDLAAGIDGVSETDGLELTSQPLGSRLPNGLLVVQDGRNRLPNAPQNFKLVDGKLIKQLIQQWLNK